MGTREADTTRAARYLRDNLELRVAAGAAPEDDLVPRYLGAGEHNLNYRFLVPSTGRAYVLRINVAKQPFHDDQVGYEFGALQALEASGRTPKPVYLDNEPGAPGEGAMVISFCEGDELDFDHLRPGDLRCAAQLMADVHAVPVEAGCRVFRPHDPLRELFGECLRHFDAYRSSAYEDLRITRWAERFVAAAERAMQTARDPRDCAHIVNTEPLPSHFLIPARAAVEAAGNASAAGRFCNAPGSFIDWERPIVGEVAQDVAYFTASTTTFWDSDFLFPAADVDAFVEDYWRAVDGRFERGNFDERFRAFRMMTALRSTTWCCRALAAYSQPGAHKTERIARKLSVYLGDEFLERLAEECFA